MTDAVDAVQAERSPGPSTQGGPQPQHTEGYSINAYKKNRQKNGNYQLYSSYQIRRYKTQ